MERRHNPVLLRESVEHLVTNPAGIYFDGTAGFGGHIEKFLEQLAPEGKLIFTDTDDTAFEHCRKIFAYDKRVAGYHMNFNKIDTAARLEGVEKFNGIFADLGVSSYQLDSADAGFSYRLKTPLDLRMDKTLAMTAADFLNSAGSDEIANVLYQYGEEKNSRRIAREIDSFRRNTVIRETGDLVSVISKITPPNYLTKTLSRVFQALRIYINDELNSLRTFLHKSVDLLAGGGRIVLLSYHSLEDRIVKEVFRDEVKGCICPPSFPVCVCGKKARLKLITRKAVESSEEEVSGNYRARSAKLRCAERLYE